MHDMMCGACISLNLCPLLSQGQIEALEHHANADLQALYLPKLISGEWTGTMNLTEPHAGSDVGALSSKAEPQADGSYKISGQKIFITWGEHDVAENICHLVLARLPGAKPGPKGISLFLVPKFIPNADGSLGARNDLRCVSLEHKLGIHGSPTAVMEFSGATGWLVGEEHNGMACMFTMMNNARLAVGMQGVGVAEGAYQHALAYAMDRKQGRAPIADGTGTIIDHADVRRMLAQMKADIFAARSIGVACAIAIDMAKATGDADWQARAALLTPIAKSFGSDTGVAVADLGVQIHGGMGFVEETAAAQYLRDARITPIYEGTNGIQSMDLVARKMMDGGAAAFALMDDMEALASASNSDLAKAVLAAIAQLRATTQWVVSQELNERFAGSVAYQKAFARVLGGYFHLVASMSGQAKRQRLARVYINSLLPEAASLCAQAQAGAADLYALELDDFAA
jgi:alkylation response protein AidB-like acyl-CoA dehydrogenase